MNRRRLTLALSYYNQPLMLARQYETWASYPCAVQEWMSFIIVDDGSPDKAAADVARPELADLQLYRIDHNVKWGWPQARNLAMHHAPPGWALLTDLDHVLLPEQAENVLDCQAIPMEHGRGYLPARRKPDGEPYKRHNDTFLIERSAFWSTGGYDLRFVRWYGTSSIFRRRLELVTGPLLPAEVTQIVYNLGGENLGDVPDAGVVGMGRKGSRDHVGRSAELAPLTKTAHLHPPPGDPLAFPWHRVI